MSDDTDKGMEWEEFGTNLRSKSPTSYWGKLGCLNYVLGVVRGVQKGHNDAMRCGSGQ